MAQIHGFESTSSRHHGCHTAGGRTHPPPPQPGSAVPAARAEPAGRRAPPPAPRAGAAPSPAAQPTRGHQQHRTTAARDLNPPDLARPRAAAPQPLQIDAPNRAAVLQSPPSCTTRRATPTPTSHRRLTTKPRSPRAPVGACTKTRTRTHGAPRRHLHRGQHGLSRRNLKRRRDGGRSRGLAAARARVPPVRLEYYQKMHCRSVLQNLNSTNLLPM